MKHQNTVLLQKLGRSLLQDELCPQEDMLKSCPLYLRMWPHLDRVFVDEIKLRWGHTGLGGPRSTDWCPYKKKGIWKQVDTHRRSLEDRGHDWSDSSTAKESQDYQQPSEARGGKEGFLSYSLQRECSSANTLILDF